MGAVGMRFPASMQSALHSCCFPGAAAAAAIMLLLLLQMGLDGFYSTSRANRCVVCGCEEHYLRYR